MKKILLLLFVGLSQFVFAQVDTVRSASKPVDKTSQLFIETPAEFIGGKEKFFEFIDQKLEYPTIARLYNVQGKVFVRFIIEKDSTVTTVECLKVSTNSDELLASYKRKLIKKQGTVEEYQKTLERCNDALKEESVRVLKLQPKWKPATQKGIVVRTNVKSPISFKLEG